MDDLQKKYFRTPEAYKKAIELLKEDEYQIRQYPDFYELEENYLSDLDELDIHLIRKARDYQEEKKKLSVNRSEDNERLNKIEEAVLRSLDKSYDKEDIPLVELIDLWVIEKNRHCKVTSMSEFKQTTALFARILIEESNNKNILVSEIKPSVINTYTDILYRLPTNINVKKNTKDKSIKEILCLGLDARSQSTVFKHVKIITELLIWGGEKNYKIVDGVVKALKVVKKPNVKNKKRRVPFDETDLENLFNSSEYRLGGFNSSTKFWLPLLGLFTGGTLGELVQLYISDISLKESVWIIDINGENDKELKVEGKDSDDGRPRIIPIHPQLIQLGFLDFMNNQQQKGEKKLFPNERRDKKNQFGNSSKTFIRYRDKVGAGPRNDNELRDFHSFRHLVRTNLEELGAESGLIDDILGHTSKDRSMGKQFYSHSQLIKIKMDAIKKLKYPSIDFTNIRDWKHHKFKI